MSHRGHDRHDYALRDRPDRGRDHAHDGFLRDHDEHRGCRAGARGHHHGCAYALAVLVHLHPLLAYLENSHINVLSGKIMANPVRACKPGLAIGNTSVQNYIICFRI